MNRKKAGVSSSRYTICRLVIILIGIIIIACSLRNSLHFPNLGEIDICNVIPIYSDTEGRHLVSPQEACDGDRAGTCDGGILPKKKSPFDPFADLTFESIPKVKEQTNARLSYYSSYDCVGTGTQNTSEQSEADSMKNARRPNFVSRSCYYRNLYYRPEDQTFHYFSDFAESSMWDEAQVAGNDSFYDLQSRMDVSVGPVPEFQALREDFDKLRIEPWRPTRHHYEQLPKNTTIINPRNSHFLLYRPHYGMNVGHLVWDDFLSMFTLLELFDKGEDLSIQPVPLFVELSDRPPKKRKRRKGKNYGGSHPLWYCNPSHPSLWKQCVNNYNRLFPSLMGIQPDECSGDILRTGNWLLGDNMIGRWMDSDPKCFDIEKHSRNATYHRHSRNNAPSEYVLLPHVLVGTGRLGFFACEGDCSIGRGPQFYRFRNFMIRNAMGPAEALEFSKQPPVGYITFSLSTNSSRPDQVYDFSKEIEVTRSIYGHDAVKVVVMATMPMKDQIELSANSAVMFTNHGGIGFVAGFLPKGSGVFVYWHGPRRMEHNFYESAGYIRPTWIGVEERQYINRTMALLDFQVRKTANVWPDIVVAAAIKEHIG